MRESLDTKEDQYLNLVEKRKRFKFSDGLLNPSEIEDGIYDMEAHLGPWSRWQGDLDASIVLVGQDWGDEKYYLNNQGHEAEYNPTNENLRKLFRSIDFDISHPKNSSKNNGLFFTNAVLGIKKEGGMQGEINEKWVYESTDEFTSILLEIIQPRIVLALGKFAFNSILYLHGEKWKKPLKDAVSLSPFKLPNGILVFPLYHCGTGSINRNRNWELQLVDWEMIKDYL